MSSQRKKNIFFFVPFSISPVSTLYVNYENCVTHVEVNANAITIFWRFAYFGGAW